MSHELNGRIGALESWARTRDRAARTAKARKASPASVDYWIDRVPEDITDPDQRRTAGEEAHRAHMLRLAAASAKARRKSA
ncbi:hypothetical protein AB0I72_19665 [Nocardiopsis sp. NPDC049922]|uniref:hypothetical protein n=1 Tax=Nocardiopsis sp. NPDC049922 TaxID=3155157 RepID=UPI0033CB1C84